MKQGRNALSALVADVKHNRFQLNKMNNRFDSRKPKFRTRLELWLRTNLGARDG
jgi:hypothetical protein